MERSRNGSVVGLEDPQCVDRSPELPPQVSHRTLWGSLTALLLLVFIAGSALGVLGIKRNKPQVVRITLQGQSGSPVNQSVVVDERNQIVTYYVTSHSNHTSVVLFDLKNGLICYKPENQGSCFLRQMDVSDLENGHLLFNMSKHKVNQFWLPGNETQRHREFVGILGGHPVDAQTLEEPLQTLCQHHPIYWARKVDGPGKQRLIYFCIDICFPSNICVSVCFYYLPE
ncbi:BRICHOS domain-containing protein 5 isoform X2 [Amia ocellicauda]|uniref:BRICHOS domain-containing protein 5 isoform X2 n=1 Tax=Amia ocellicauda TaxID=2972642 RepID=UPI003463E8A1